MKQFFESTEKSQQFQKKMSVIKAHVDEKMNNMVDVCFGRAITQKTVLNVYIHTVGITGADDLQLVVAILELC